MRYSCRRPLCRNNLNVLLKFFDLLVIMVVTSVMIDALYRDISQQTYYKFIEKKIVAGSKL